MDQIKKLEFPELNLTIFPDGGALVSIEGSTEEIVNGIVENVDNEQLADIILRSAYILKRKLIMKIDSEYKILGRIRR